jgi:hypothetical protein
MPRLFGVSPFCRWDSRGALHARVVLSVLAFHHRQPYRVVPVVGSLSGLSDRRLPVEAMRSVVCCAGCVKSGGLLRPCRGAVPSRWVNNTLTYQ